MEYEGSLLFLQKPITGPTNPVHMITHYFSKANFNLILPSALQFQLTFSTYSHFPSVTNTFSQYLRYNI